MEIAEPLTVFPIDEPVADVLINGMEALYGIRFYIPPYSEYRTALGSALSYINRQKGLIPL